MNCSFADRQFWTEFIELYRDNECLWKIKSKEYLDRNKKNAAYKVLVEKLRERDSEAHIDTVKKRINNMRSVFRKEIKKINASVRSGARADDVYTPQLWYYNLLLFLKDEELPRLPVSNLDEETNDQETSRSPTDLPEQDSPSRPDSDFGFYSFRSRSPTPRKKKKSSPLDHRAESVLAMAGDRLSALRREDEFDIVGKNVAAKLRKLPSNVEIVAEKLINDVLYEAQMGTLTPYAKLVTEQL